MRWLLFAVVALSGAGWIHSAPADAQNYPTAMLRIIAYGAPGGPSDSLRDFSGIVLTGFFDSLLVMHPSVGAATVSQLLDFAKAKPATIVWGHFGINTTGNLYQEWLKKSRGAVFYPVPYKTSGPVLQALITGEAQIAVYAWPNALAHLKSGKLKALAVTADKRLAFLAEVPTFEELGIKLPLRGWFGYHLPAATPRPIVTRLNNEIRKIMKDATYIERVLNAQGIMVGDGTPEEFDTFVRTQLQATVEMMNYLDIKPQ